MSIEDIMKEREARYGRFRDQAVIAQNLKQIWMASQVGKPARPAIMVEAMEIILHKISRICNGDPMYADTWDDIAGYALRVSEWLKENKTDSPVKEWKKNRGEQSADVTEKTDYKDGTKPVYGHEKDSVYSLSRDPERSY